MNSRIQHQATIDILRKHINVQGTTTVPSSKHTETDLLYHLMGVTIHPIIPHYMTSELTREKLTHKLLHSP
jgi:hypothetical protein